MSFPVTMPGGIVVSIPTLSGMSFKRWYEQLEASLGMVDLDIALKEDKPAAITDFSTPDEKHKMEKWMNANKKSMLLMRQAIPESMRDGVQAKETAKEYLKEIKGKFELSDRGQRNTLMNKLTNAKYNGNGSIRDHFMELSAAAEKIKAMGINVDNEFVIHCALSSLPEEYCQIQVAYNTQEEEWDMNKLISVCTKEEQRLKKKIESVNITGHHSREHKGKGKVGVGPHRKDRQSFRKGKPYDRDMSDVECFWCHKKGHMKRECKAREAWLEKKKKGTETSEKEDAK